MASLIILQAGAAGAFFLFAFLLFAIGIALTVWTYTDAQRNSSHPAFLWAVVVFLAPLLGIVLYLLVGRDQR
jgi:glucose uptake protein GlcU